LRGSDFAVIERQRAGAAELRQPHLKKIENCGFRMRVIPTRRFALGGALSIRANSYTNVRI
jgi:hypothetical protein